jgi:tetratricopeptide (TPR) repeat protein
LGQPDLVATMPQPFMLAPGDTDRYRQIVYPLSLPAGRYVRALEFRAGTSPVHHAIIRIDPTRSSRRHDAEDKEPGFEGGMALDAKNPEGHFVGWSPGRGPIVSPAGMPWRLDRGADLVVELHLIPGKTAEPVQPAIGLYFTDTPPLQTPVELTIGVRTMDIPAGDPSYRVTSSFTVPVDVTLLSLYPHAHYLGKTVHVTATLPDGTVRRVLDIPHWDFHWQTEYRLEKPLPLPHGTSVTMDYVYDNSAANEDNPSSPPKRVLYGLHSSDEMATLAMQVLTGSQADSRRLTAAVFARAAQESLDGAVMNAKREPNNPDYQWDLGRSLVEANRPADALAPLQAAVKGLPRHARARDFLGRVLFAAGRRDEALALFQQAVALDPGDELLPYDLGKVLDDLGRIPEAAKAFQQALAINPDYGPAYSGLGVALLRAGRPQDAVQAFQRSVILTPDSPDAENGLAVALAQAGRTQEALEHVKRALAIDPDFGPARDNLARLTRGK